jgi:hypothetical protein
MGFLVPNGLDPRDEAYLRKICFMQLFAQNKDVFQAAAIFIYGECVNKIPGVQSANDFWTYCAVFGMRLSDPPSSRAQNVSHIAEQDLAMAIWTHLENRKVVKGTPQGSMNILTTHCELFAKLIAIQTFDDDPQLGGAEYIDAKRVLDSLAMGRRKITPVPLKNPFGRTDPRAC